MKDLKYLLAFIPVLSVYAGFYTGGIWTYSGVFIAFGCVPVLELIFKGTTENPQESINPLKERFFDFLLYLNIPLLYGLLFYFWQILTENPPQTYEIVGMTLSLSVIIGTCGINVGHELGHRTTRYEQFFSKILLLPALYMHFFIEHNRGHHKNVATDDDPASARLGEPIYVFFIRSVVGGYLSAWRLEKQRLQQIGKSNWSWSNEMVRFQVVQTIYLVVIGSYFGLETLFFTLLAAIGGFLLLETVNYIEHYGLRRRRLSSGKYENVAPHHSWNSNHEIGRILLYELTRHSDHHYKATRKYHTLRHFDQVPQLPFGYPLSMLFALIPPLWFRLMDKKMFENQNISS